MAIDATFWVAVSFFIFIGGLVYLKIPQKVSNILSDQILDIKKEIDESEKLRAEAKTLLANSQKKLDEVNNLKKEILEQAKKDSEMLVIEINEKFYKSSEIKKKLAENKIIQMKENAIKEIKNISAKIAIESVIRIINTSIDKSKLDKIFEQNLEEAKTAFKK
jgi:F-type H+-transporting ATPase subunit b|tara:strand:+ start:472 stop:960 length:489 start_codon:yes stop_codon:yes gene_type:complete